MSDTSGRPSGAKGAAEEGDAASTKALSAKELKKLRRLEKVKEKEHENALSSKKDPKANDSIDNKGEQPEKVAEKGGHKLRSGEEDSSERTDPTDVPVAVTTGVKQSQMTKAERRAMQEAQRQAKAAKNSSATSNSDGSTAANLSALTSSKTVQLPEKTEEDKLKTPQDRTIESSQGQVSFFLHLPQPVKPSTITSGMKFDDHNLHPAFVRLGVRSAHVEAFRRNDDEHCVTFLQAVLQLIDSLRSLDPEKPFSREFEKQLKLNTSFLASCRALPVSTKNAVRFLKSRISNLAVDEENESSASKVAKAVGEYLGNKVQLSRDAILAEENWASFIKNGDHLLTFAHSSTALRLLDTASKSRNFSVTIIDSSPSFPGRRTLAQLEHLGIQCNYGLVTSIGYWMPRVTKVLIGAHALLGNGAVMASAGSGLVMLSAKAFNKPVIVCCETFKFSEKIQTDSIVSNELLQLEPLILNPEIDRGIRNSSHLESLFPGCEPESVAPKESSPFLSVLNCALDVTPPSLVAVVVSEVGSMPSLSVPVIYRWKCKDLQDYL